MSEPLWSDERIQEAIHSSRMTKGTFDTIFAAAIMATIRNEYEALIARMNDQMTLLAEVQEDRIAELEAKLATSEELAEQHLAEIDRQAARIAELEASHAALVADQLAVTRLLNAVGIENYGYKNQAARVEVLIERLRTSQNKVISIAKERDELRQRSAGTNSRPEGFGVNPAGEFWS